MPYGGSIGTGSGRPKTPLRQAPSMSRAKVGVRQADKKKKKRSK